MAPSGGHRRVEPAGRAPRRACRAPRDRDDTGQHRGRVRGRPRRGLGETPGHRGAARPGRGRDHDRADRPVGRRGDADGGDRAASRGGRPGRAGDAQHAVDRPRGDRRALRRIARGRPARHARRGSARPPRLCRPRPRALDGRRDRGVGLRARLLRAPRRGDDRGRPPARALARDLDAARHPDDAGDGEAAPRRGAPPGRVARDGHLARRHDHRCNPRARVGRCPRGVPQRDPGCDEPGPRARRRRDSD